MKTKVEIDGEQEALATIILNIIGSLPIARQLAGQTGMRKIAWEMDGHYYELLVDAPKKTPRVVVIMHGIRDEGEWIPPLERFIQDETGADAKALNIDRISLTRFLLADRFLGYVKSYSDAALQLLSHYDEVNVFFIAHSYGTWCLRDLLSNWPYKGNIMPAGIIVCGSILPMNCPWGKIHSNIFKRPRQDGEIPWVWNDIGGRDPFPLLARVVSEGYGDSGVNRFTDPTPKLIVNRVHGRLDHGGFFIKDENGNNVLNKEFIRDYWLPIIRGEEAPHEGVEPRISPFIKGLSYWVKTAREMIGWVFILELIGWPLIWFGRSEWFVLPGWCLASFGGVIMVGWLVMGWWHTSSRKPPKPRPSPVILKFILILLMIVGVVWFAATVLHYPPSTPSPIMVIRDNAFVAPIPLSRCT